MEHSHLLIVAIVDHCRVLIQQAEATECGLPVEVQPKHLLWMCDAIEHHAEDWPATKLHRWLGFVQGAMIANRILDLDGVKAMSHKAKTAFGTESGDPDLIDHLDPGTFFEFDLGGSG